MRVVGTIGVLFTLVALTGQAVAGELVLANGSRLPGNLANEVLLVSTGSGLVEIRPDAVSLLTPTEIRLKDGRILQGTLVGGRLKARTPLGELAITTEELASFRADGADPAMKPDAPAAAPAPAAAVSVPATSAAGEAERPQPGSSQAAGLPSVTLYQNTPPPPAPAATAPPAPPEDTARVEVVLEESTLHRDAVALAAPVGKVTRGERVRYLDSIDRRLRIFNAVIFDGGHWIKVRAVDGTEGWLPASKVREAP